MNSKRLLGVDVDLVVAPTDVGWWSYLRERSFQYPLGDYEKPPYNLGQLFPQVVDPYEYWRNLDYSEIKPINGCVEALEKLSKYFGIFFISQQKGMHGKSKYYFLDEHFPFKAGVMMTKEKWGMNNSVVAHIDDRKEHLKGFDFNKRILFNTSYTQSVECPTAIDFSVWNDEIVKRICDEYL